MRIEKFIVRNFKVDLKNPEENFWIDFVIRVITWHNFQFCHAALFNFMYKALEPV